MKEIKIKGLKSRETNPAQILNSLSEREIRSEYSRLRKIANQRLKALGNYYPESKIYQKYNGQFITLREMDSVNEIAYRLSDMIRYLHTEAGTVTGLKRIRNEILDKMHEQGYNFVTKSNFLEFTEFMDTLDTQARNMRYDSERLVDLFEITFKKKIPTDVVKRDFEYFMDNKDKISKIKKGDYDSVEEVRQAVKEYDSRRKKKGSRNNRKS